ncbi:MAG: NAD(P)-binding domain-containing protein, partial [Armatimonadota bacterium]|nr:NAD(P)-binding domain-containing protein [Armatimonadota bacterium]
MNNTKPRVAFIGLGLMGMGMARNIGRAGFPLVVFNRTRAKADSLAAEITCTVANSPAEAAAGADIVITMVSDVPDVEEVYLGAGGILESARPGLVCVDMSTVGSECVEKVAQRLQT